MILLKTNVLAHFCFTFVSDVSICHTPILPLSANVSIFQTPAASFFQPMAALKREEKKKKKKWSRTYFVNSPNQVIFSRN